MKRTFVDYRKQVYASITGTKGKKEKLDKVIEALEYLRVEYYNNRGFKNAL